MTIKFEKERERLAQRGEHSPPSNVRGVARIFQREGGGVCQTEGTHHNIVGCLLKKGVVQALTESASTFFGIILLREHFFLHFIPESTASIFSYFRLIICIILR